jgi:hypothetical protein
VRAQRLPRRISREGPPGPLVPEGEGRVHGGPFQGVLGGKDPQELICLLVEGPLHLRDGLQPPSPMKEEVPGFPRVAQAEEGVGPPLEEGSLQVGKKGQRWGFRLHQDGLPGGGLEAVGRKELGKGRFHSAIIGPRWKNPKSRPWPVGSPRRTA